MSEKRCDAAPARSSARWRSAGVTCGGSFSAAMAPCVLSIASTKRERIPVIAVFPVPAPAAPTGGIPVVYGGSLRLPPSYGIPLSTTPAPRQTDIKKSDNGARLAAGSGGAVTRPTNTHITPPQSGEFVEATEVE